MNGAEAEREEAAAATANVGVGSGSGVSPGVGSGVDVGSGAGAAAGVLSYDDDCGFCRRSLDFLRRAGFEGEVRPLGPDQPRDTAVYEADGRRYVRSAAVLRPLLRARWGWRVLARAGLMVPRPIRDGVYGWVARHRGRL